MRQNKILFSTLDKRNAYLDEHYPNRKQGKTDGTFLTNEHIILVNNLLVIIYKRKLKPITI
jgi:hypothetical protein